MVGVMIPPGVQGSGIVSASTVYVNINVHGVNRLAPLAGLVLAALASASLRSVGDLLRSLYPSASLVRCLVSRVAARSARCCAPRSTVSSVG